VLVNSNPATIMTDKDIADHVYIEPLTAVSVTEVIRRLRQGTEGKIGEKAAGGGGSAGPAGS